MNEKPRRWFQIHLSTAVLLMLTAGVLLGLNISHVVRGYVYAEDGWCYVYPYGWPFASEWYYYVGNFETHTLPVAYVWNGLFTLGCMCAVVIPAEHRIRRREARKP